MIGGVAATRFAMQKLFTVQKEKHLHTEHGLDVFFKQTVNHDNLFALPFLNFN